MTNQEDALKKAESRIPPDGMQRADTDVDNYPAWDFAKGTLTGVVVKVKTVELIRRGEPVDVRMAVIAPEIGDYVILWESANLKVFFDSISHGTRIDVTQSGEVQLAGNRTMKLYDAFYS